ncbi:MAG: hypothetical protein LUI87_09900 [Lachnospiraceae bacterium]|nr:hypothetical protein [Lachnospiraceae bacterium]
MDMTEVARMVLGLRVYGWDEKKINDFMLWIGTGDEKYKPQEGSKNSKSKLQKNFS